MKRIIRFTASWCQPCKSLAKNIESAELKIPVEVIDIDENSSIAVEYGIRSVPTLIMLDENIEVKRVSGALNPQKLKEWVE